jgi:hypothetical protein
MADAMTLTRQLPGQSSSTFIRPSQRRHWIPSGCWLHQSLQCGKQGGIFQGSLLTSTTRSAYLPWFLITSRLFSLLQLAPTEPDGTLCQSGCFGYGGDSTMTQHQGFSGCPQTTGSFIQFGLQQLVLMLNRLHYRFRYHEVILKNELNIINKNI